MSKIQYVSKKFRSDNLELIKKINDVIADYDRQGFSLTLRQVYYQMVARDIIPNNERSYEGFLFTQWKGEPMSPDTLTRWFSDFVKRTDLPPIHLHSLRHTNASILIAAGEDVRTVSGRFGDSQTSTTLNIYSHVIQSADARASDTLENILKPLGNKQNVE